jgi:SpoU rRNA methylase family enzyme
MSKTAVKYPIQSISHENIIKRVIIEKINQNLELIKPTVTTIKIGKNKNIKKFIITLKFKNNTKKYSLIVVFKFKTVIFTDSQIDLKTNLLLRIIAYLQ